MIVDDHPLVRRGLAELISAEPDLEICGEAADADEAIQRIQDLKPDLAVIDIALKGSDGITLIKRIKAHQLDVKMLVSSMHDESLFAERALRAGAMGYINKEEATDLVIQAIRQVLGGQVYLSAEMTNRLLHGVVSSRELIEKSPVDTLSDRELEVFGLLGRGLTTREIAEQLHLSVKTIETYREHIKSKLSLETSAELTRHAVQWVLENG